VVDALTHQSTFAYDGNGNQVTMTDALNHTTGFEYDALKLTRTSSIAAIPSATSSVDA